jgi:hypothetical protein
VFLNNFGKNRLKGQEVPLNSSLRNAAKMKQPIAIPDVFFMPYAFQNSQSSVDILPSISRFESPVYLSPKLLVQLHRRFHNGSYQVVATWPCFAVPV